MNKTGAQASPLATSGTDGATGTVALQSNPVNVRQALALSKLGDKLKFVGHLSQTASVQGKQMAFQGCLSLRLGAFA